VVSRVVYPLPFGKSNYMRFLKQYISDSIKWSKLIRFTFTIVGLVSITETHGQILNRAREREKSPNILVLIADDWGYPNGGAYGDNGLLTPNFDRIAKEGVLFTNAFTIPSCSPSRASLLTGQWPHELEEGVHLKGILADKFPNYVTLLAEHGYVTGSSKKGWGPGNYELGGYPHNPAGPRYPNFHTFF